MSPSETAIRNGCAQQHPAISPGPDSAPQQDVVHECHRICRKNYAYVLAGITTPPTGNNSRAVWFEPAAAAGMGSVHETMCAISKIGGGVIADALPAVELLSGSLAMTAFANLAVAATPLLPLMIAAWGFNGFFQAFGWAAVSRIFFAWFPDPTTRGSWYSLLSASQNAGSAAAAVIVPAAIAWAGDWRAALLAPAGIGLVVAVALQLIVRPEPSVVDDIATSAAVHPSASEPAKPAPAGGGWPAVVSVVSDWRQWLLGAAYLFLSIVRSGTADWAVRMLGESDAGSLTEAQAGWALVAMEAGGFTGALLGGVATDAISGGRRSPVMLMLAIVAIPVCWTVYGGGPALHQAVASLGLGSALSTVHCVCAVYFVLGVTTFTPHVLLGLAAREMAGPSAISTAGGFVKGLGQLGSAVAGSPLAIVQQQYGWSGVSACWAACMAIAAICFAAVAPAEQAETATVRVENGKPKRE